MNDINDNFRKWAARLNNKGQVFIKTHISKEKDEILVYLTKGKSRQRVIGKLFFITKKSDLYRKLIDAYSDVHLKVRQKTKSTKLHRACSLLAATKILLTECVPKSKQEYMTKVKWLSSVSDKKDVGRLQTTRATFTKKDLKAMIQLKELAASYPFKGVKVELPPRVEQLPLDFLKYKFKQTKKRKAGNQKSSQKNAPKPWRRRSGTIQFSPEWRRHGYQFQRFG